MPLNRLKRMLWSAMFSMVFLVASAQNCQENIDWMNYIGDQLPDDISFFTIQENPIVLQDLNLTITNKSPSGGGSILNNTIRDEMLGGLNQTYVLSLNGEIDDFIELKLAFSEAVQGLNFTIVDIDSNPAGTWNDSIHLKVYNATTELNITNSNIASIGSFVAFDDINNSFAGWNIEDNPTGTRGNIDLSFNGSIDSLVISYHYGSMSNADALGNQIIGIGNLNVTSDLICEKPRSESDMSCALANEKHVINVLDNDEIGSGSWDYSSLDIITAPTNGSGMFDESYNLCYTPSSDMTGMDMLEYKICNEFGLCDTSYVEFFITSGNDIRGVKDHFTVLANLSFEGNVLDNDYDPQEDNINLSTNLVTAPQNGSVSLDPFGYFIYNMT